MYRSMFRTQDHTKMTVMLRIMLRNVWKCLLNSVLWFVYIILKFNALCNAYAVQMQYTE